MPIDRIHEAIRFESRLRELILRQGSLATSLSDTLASPRSRAGEVHAVADFVERHARSLGLLADEIRALASRYEESP